MGIIIVCAYCLKTMVFLAVSQISFFSYFTDILSSVPFRFFPLVFLNFNVGVLQVLGFPGGSVGKESSCWHRRCWFHPWVGKIPWRRAWRNPTPAFLPGKLHGQRSLAGYSPWGHRVGHDWSDWACVHVTGFRPCSAFFSFLPSPRPAWWFYFIFKNIYLFGREAC